MTQSYLSTHTQDWTRQASLAALYDHDELYLDQLAEITLAPVVVLTSELAMLELRSFVQQHSCQTYRLRDGYLCEAMAAMRKHGVVSTESALAMMRAGRLPLASLVAPEQRMVRPKQELPQPAGFSEAELHAATIAVRNAETEPPEFERFPVGTLAWTWPQRPELVELREYRLDDPRLAFSEGLRPNLHTEKYTEWVRAGSLPPPGRAVEMGNGRVQVSDGHHRGQALKDAGLKTIQLWVGLTRNKPIGRGNTYPTWIEHGRAQRWMQVVRIPRKMWPFNSSEEQIEKRVV